MSIEPAHDLVVLLSREREAVSNASEEPAISGAQASDGRFFQAPCGTVGGTQGNQIVSEFEFHPSLIVGQIPLFNRKVPIRLGSLNFSILSACR